MEAHLDEGRLRAVLRGEATDAEKLHVDGGGSGNRPGCAQCQQRLEEMLSTIMGMERAAAGGAQPSGGDGGPPRVLGGYQLQRPLGSGGMGVVWLAQRADGAKAAVKLMREDRQYPERFQREGRVKLDHANIVAFIAAGNEGGWEYLVMEYIEGQSLSDLLTSRGLFPVSVACELARQIAEGLRCAHAAGLVHRDIKPSNVMVSRSGVAKVVDWGLVKVQDGRALTEPHTLLGTRDYMAPEQTRDARVDSRADLYSLGCVLYEMLAGRPPFAGVVGPTQKMLAHQNEPPPSIARGDIPQGLRQLLFDKLLAKEPDARIQSAGEVAEQLLLYAGGVDLERWLRTGAALASNFNWTSAVAGPGRLGEPLDLVFCDERRVLGRLSKPEGVLPARSGQLVQLHVTVARPAHVYLLWLERQEVAPVHPRRRRGSRWELEDQDEALRWGLQLPPPTEGGFAGWPLSGEAGVETLLLLEARARLSDGERDNLLADLARLPVLEALPNPMKPVWFDLRSDAAPASEAPVARARTRSIDTERPRVVTDPAFQVNSLVRELRNRLGEWDEFESALGVSFMKRGAES